MTGDRPPGPGQYAEPGGLLPSGELAGLDPAAWARANAVQVVPLDYARPGADGGWRGVYTPVPIAHPPQWCEHLDSVCRSCLPAWLEDHALALFRHGPPGARAGCACPVCRTSRPRSNTDPQPDEATGPGDDDDSTRTGTAGPAGVATTLPATGTAADPATGETTPDPSRLDQLAAVLENARRRRGTPSPAAAAEEASPADQPPTARQERTASGTVIPAALAARPADRRRRLPIPFVSEHPSPDGTGPVVDFTTVNTDRAAAVGRWRRCSLCTEPMGYWIGFLGGAKAAESLTYSDPPGHPECLRVAVDLCPYIAIGAARRASDRHRPPGTVTPPGFTAVKPEQWVLGLTRSYRMVLVRGTVLFLPAPFTHLQRWRYDQHGHLEPADSP